MADGKNFFVRFWGVRGSIPSPMTETGFVNTLDSLAAEYEGENYSEIFEKKDNLPLFLDFIRGRKGTIVHGGNTSCVEVLSAPDDVNQARRRFVLDMGTGIRPLGDSLMKELFATKGLDITFLISHVHWDHIQGLPFFSPLYMNKKLGINNRWHFFGGTKWQKEAETCLAGQMDYPNFPVTWKEIDALTAKMDFIDVSDMFSTEVGGVKITARKLHHPQETYGWRLEENGRVVVYATDHEPFDPLYPHPPLVQLAKGADLLITDCQYSDHGYNGNPGPVKHGWGHSYPSAVARVVAEAGVKNLALFHHDPGASRLDIQARVFETKAVLSGLGSDCNVFAAWEGLEISV